MWGGRFESAPSELLRRLNDSFGFDRELFAHDVKGSIAWVAALAEAGIVTPAEAEVLRSGLRAIPAPEEKDLGHHEDVHSYVEATLFSSIGDLAGKLHSGRSRNDQVATDLKLWLKDATSELAQRVEHLARALSERALKDAATPMPGYTHLQQAEPVTFGHWCLAYVEMLLRDLDRLQDAIERGDECPLGSGALAGTPLLIDREALARSLGFSRATRNSIDAVSDRDFAVDYLYCAAMLLTHLSRLAEDLIFFTTDEAKYAQLPDALATGSSRMPQKKNPDVLELTRGHAARAIGELTGLLTLIKGLPLAYNKDLQLDKEPLFRTRTALSMLLPVITAVAKDLILDTARLRAAAGSHALTATAVADEIAKRGMPFRQAHDLVSSSLDSLETLAAEYGVSTESTLGKKASLGGTAPQRVREAAQAALHRLGAALPLTNATHEASEAAEPAGTPAHIGR
ncbi:MAG TPA: argininosuccinate lyase [Thermoanaerobaculia bacterium]|nr:argininosuccinate lyase [Thermoanaerobaculia bacterium]